MYTYMYMYMYIFRTVILPKSENVLGVTFPCFSIRYLCKLLPNYTLIAKSDLKTIQNSCYETSMYVYVLKLDELSYSVFFDIIGVMKS